MTYNFVVSSLNSSHKHTGVAAAYVNEIRGLELPKIEGVERLMKTTTSENESSDHSGPCIVGGAHALILRISSFVGLAPLRFESRGDGFVVTISNAMCLYSYILSAVLVTSTMFGLSAEISVGTEMSVRMSTRVSQVVSTCDVLVVVATAGTGICCASRRMRHMLQYMNKIAYVDLNIGAHYSVATERKLCAILLVILVFFGILLADDFVFYVLQARRVDRQWEVLTNYIGFYILWFVVMVLELQFAFTALSVRARFQAVNDVLVLTANDMMIPIEKPKEPVPLNMFAIRVANSESKRLTTVSILMEPPATNENPIVRKTVTGDGRLVVSPCEAIRRIASLHGVLCEVVRCVGGSYDLPLIVVLISTLLHLIVTPYFLIMEIIVSTNRVHFLVLQFLWCATHMLRLLVVVEPCHYTVTEGKRTEDLVCRLLAAGPASGVLPTRLELFSRQLMLRSLIYSPLGMCIMDRPLVVSALGAVMTYLVILIQFQRYESY